MPSSTKSLDSWVVGGRHRHHRTRDHFGADSDLYVTIDEQLGPWGAGTPVKYVLEDLFGRVNSLTSANHNVRALPLDAFVLAPSTTAGGRGTKPLNAVVFAGRSGSFTLIAMVVTTQKLFTVDAYVSTESRFYLSAYVV